jgi:hypothetical protein
LDGRGVEVRDMRDAEMTLAIIRERGRQLPYGHPYRETDRDPSDSGPGRSDINHWRAVCGKSRMHGSEGGRWKRAELIGTSPAAYPTRETESGRAHEDAGPSPVRLIKGPFFERQVTGYGRMRS